MYVFTVSSLTCQPACFPLRGCEAGPVHVALLHPMNARRTHHHPVPHALHTVHDASHGSYLRGGISFLCPPARVNRPACMPTLDGGRATLPCRAVAARHLGFLSAVAAALCTRTLRQLLSRPSSLSPERSPKVTRELLLLLPSATPRPPHVSGTPRCEICVYENSPQYIRTTYAVRCKERLDMRRLSSTSRPRRRSNSLAPWTCMPAERGWRALRELTSARCFVLLALH